MDTVPLAVLLGIFSMSGARPQVPAVPAPFSMAAAAPGPVPVVPVEAGDAPQGLAPMGPAPAVTFVPVIQQHFEQAPDGQYRWNYSGADGTNQEAVGVLSAGLDGQQTIAVQGSYSYQTPEGQVQVNYVADEFGFQPTGAHIHPGILEAVRRQVELARSEPANLYNEAGFPINQGLQGSGPMVSSVPLPGSAPSGPAVL